MIMPAFHRFPKEAAIIGRMLAGYGELEFMLAICAGKAIDNRDIALKAMFRNRTESGRIQIADAIIHPSLAKAKLKGKYTDALGAIRHCLKIRNQFAHCLWADHSKSGLFFTNLETAALPPEGFSYDWLHVDVPLLQKQESYFEYAMHCLLHIEREYDVKSERSKAQAFAMPRKQRPPSLHNLQAKHRAPWKGPNPVLLANKF